MLWFAFKLVSLNHWEQSIDALHTPRTVVICFQISIFEPLGTIPTLLRRYHQLLWFAFKLVSLNHWEQFRPWKGLRRLVVICFQISIFEPLGTIWVGDSISHRLLWFAFKLVSLNHWEQYIRSEKDFSCRCDLLSN